MQKNLANGNMSYEMPKWAQVGLTLAAILLFLIIVLAVALHISNPGRFPAPTDLGAEMFLALGLTTMIVLYFPWQTLKFGGVEIERVAQNITEEFGETFKLLAEQPANFENDKNVESELETEGFVATGNESHVTGATPPDSRQFKPSRKLYTDAQKKSVKRLFKENMNVSLSLSEIISISLQNPQYSELGPLEPAIIRAICSVLVHENILEVRVSQRGIVVYRNKL